MSFDPVFYILKPANFLPATEAEAWLGRVVSHYSAPHYASVPDDTSGLNIRPLRQSVLHNVEKFVKASRGTTYEPQLQGVVEGCASKVNETTFDFSTAQIRIVQLQNHPEVFARFLQLCAQTPSVNRTIREWAKPFGEPLFMVVGVMVWTDAKFHSGTSTNHDTSVKVIAPLNAVANAVAASQLGMPVIPDGVGDVSFGVKRDNTGEATLNASQAGEHVFALEYRAIRRLRHTGFTRFGMDQGLPRFPGQLTMGNRDDMIEDKKAGQEGEETEKLTLEVEDVPWTESVEEASDAVFMEVEKVSGLEVGFSFAFSAEPS